MKKLMLLFGLLLPMLGFAQSYSIDWYKIAGGGGTSTGATYQVTGTTTVSLPLALVSAENLTRLETLGKLPTDSDAVRALRQSLANDLSAEWEKFRQFQAHRQSGLGFDFPDELKLG